MEIQVLESTKNKLKFKLVGETHTFCGLLKEELWKDKSTSIAGYRIETALESSPIFTLETHDKDPKKVLLDAVSRLKKQVKEITPKLIKLVK